MNAQNRLQRIKIDAEDFEYPDEILNRSDILWLISEAERLERKADDAVMLIHKLQAENEQLQAAVSKCTGELGCEAYKLAGTAIETGSLLRKPMAHAPPGCHCTERCMAPVVQGRQQPCRDPEKAARFAEPANERREYHTNGTYWSGVPTVDIPEETRSSKHGFDPPAKPMTVYWAEVDSGNQMEWPRGMRVVSYGEYLEAISMLNKVLAFFNPTYESPGAAEVYCEGFKMAHGHFPPAWKRLKERS